MRIEDDHTSREVREGTPSSWRRQFYSRYTLNNCYATSIQCFRLGDRLRWHNILPQKKSVLLFLISRMILSGQFYGISSSMPLREALALALLRNCCETKDSPVSLIYGPSNNYKLTPLPSDSETLPEVTIFSLTALSNSY
jgi:hypothetical protein